MKTQEKPDPRIREFMELISALIVEVSEDASHPLPSIVFHRLDKLTGGTDPDAILIRKRVAQMRAYVAFDQRRHEEACRQSELARQLSDPGQLEYHVDTATLVLALLALGRVAEALDHAGQGAMQARRHGLPRETVRSYFTLDELYESKRWVEHATFRAALTEYATTFLRLDQDSISELWASDPEALLQRVYEDRE